MITDLRKYITFFKNIVFYFTDSFAFLFPKPTSGPSLKILLVRLDVIGDFILWLDAAKEFKILYPSSQFQIILLGNEDWTPLALQLPFFDEVWPVNRKKFYRNPFYRLRILIKIRQTGFSEVIHPVISREVFADLIVRISGAKERTGSQGDLLNMMKWEKGFSDKWYTRLIPTVNEKSMVLESNAIFLRGLGSSHFRANIPVLEIQNLSVKKFNHLKEFYILFPGAGNVTRRWPISNFANLAINIFNLTQWKGIICGGEGEEELGEFLIRETNIPLENWIGQTSLLELIDIISKAKILIGNETGSIHIATATSTHSVCILGGGHYGHFLPYQIQTPTNRPLPVPVIYQMDCYGCNWQCIYSLPKKQEKPCIQNISVDMVWGAVQNVLNKNNLII